MFPLSKQTQVPTVESVSQGLGSGVEDNFECQENKRCLYIVMYIKSDIYHHIVIYITYTIKEKITGPNGITCATCLYTKPRFNI